MRIPRAYVEPIPALWHAPAEFGNRGTAMLAKLGLATGSGSGAAAYFTTLASTATMLNMVGKVLHAGTGFRRLLVVTFNTCSGPRAYAGVVSAYHETVTQNFQRLTDQAWTNQLAGTPAAEVSWLDGLVSR